MISLPATVAPDTVLRLATPDDAEEISALVRARSTGLGYGTAEEFEVWFEARYSRAEILYRVSKPGCVCLVVREYDRVIGYAHIYLGTGYLGGLHVARDGEGIGSLLISARIEIARVAGLDRVWLAVAEKNNRMINQAIRNGFSYWQPSPNRPRDFVNTEFHRYELHLQPKR